MFSSTSTLLLLSLPLTIFGAAMPQPTQAAALEARILTTLGVPCTVTKVVGEPVQDLISTIYKNVITSTAATDCSGCRLKIVTRTVDEFEPYTATTYITTPTTVYDWVCLPSGLRGYGKQ